MRLCQAQPRGARGALARRGGRVLAFRCASPVVRQPTAAGAGCLMLRVRPPRSWCPSWHGFAEEQMGSAAAMRCAAAPLRRLQSHRTTAAPRAPDAATCRSPAAVAIRPRGAPPSNSPPSTSPRCVGSSAWCGRSAQRATPASGGVRVEVAGDELFWSAAEVHCRVFYEERDANRAAPQGHQTSPATSATMQQRREGGASAGGLAGFLRLPAMPGLARLRALLNRLDRVSTLQALEFYSRSGAGNCALLLAFDDDEVAASKGHASTSLGAADVPHRRRPDSDAEELSAECRALVEVARGSELGDQVLRSLLGGHSGKGLGISPEDRRLVGIAYADSFGDLVPARELDPQLTGAFGCVRRTGIGYISNVAVLPGARGRGIARTLVDRAEALCAEWGCRSAGLHCDSANTPAAGLYTSMGYKRTVLEPAIMPWLNGRPPNRCHFFLRRLPGQVPDAGEGLHKDEPAAAALK